MAVEWNQTQITDQLGQNLGGIVGWHCRFSHLSFFISFPFALCSLLSALLPSLPVRKELRNQRPKIKLGKIREGMAQVSRDQSKGREGKGEVKAQ